MCILAESGVCLNLVRVEIGETAFPHTLSICCLIMEQVRKFSYKGELIDVDLASCKTIRDCAREFLRVVLF